MADSPWRIEASVAHLKHGDILGQLQLLRPDLGLRFESWRGVALESISILGVVFPDVDSSDASCDAYVRGSDLIVTYPETTARPFRVQAYWRFVGNVMEHGIPAFAVDLHLSVQTPLWDCTPKVHTCTYLNGIETLQRAQLALATAEHERTSTEPVLNAIGEVFSATVADATPPIQYVEMIHARDLQSHRVEMFNDGWHLEHDLFEPGLEKGVIRRVRVRGILSAGDADDERVERAYQAFHQAPLPLTT